MISNFFSLQDMIMELDHNINMVLTIMNIKEMV